MLKVIIDSESLDNLASKELVDKLQLQRLRHPKPYHVAQIQKEHKLLVSEQCPVKFKIENYHDEVLCDTMPMDCCHILLGRPWQYDRQALHDGRLNQCTIWVKRMKQILLPLVETLSENNCTMGRICLVEGNKFAREMKEYNVFYALIPRKIEKQDEIEHAHEIEPLVT